MLSFLTLHSAVRCSAWRKKTEQCDFPFYGLRNFSICSKESLIKIKLQFCSVLVSRPAGLRHHCDFAALFLRVHVKMIILGSRCLTGCKPAGCSSAVADWAFGWPTGRLAGLQRVSGVVILLLICVGQGLVRRCHCISHIALHGTVVPWSSGPLMFLQSVIQFQTYTHFSGVYCGSVPFAQLPNQCLIRFSNFSFLPAETELTLTACKVVWRVFWCTECFSVSQQLFREVRIMKILNHPNIGKFKQEPAAAWWQLSNNIELSIIKPTPSTKPV